MRSREEILTDAKKIYDFLADVPPAPEKADIILAAGSHDLRGAERAAEIFVKGAAPLIICSGGYGKMTEGRFRKPEGELFAERCMALGVPEEKIIIENRATNTGENFTFSHKLLDAQGIVPHTGIATCKPYMAKRTWASGTKQWGEVTWYISVPQLSFEEYPTEDTPLESTIQLMTGDLQRLRVYAEKGFQAPVEVPDEIWEINERLIRDGYDLYAIR